MVSGLQYCPLLTMPLSMTSSFRMHALRATFLHLPATSIR